MSSTPSNGEDPVKVYLLPNLMTAGNLICGFTAILNIFNGIMLRRENNPDWEQNIIMSLYLILGACFFDMLDGRLARLAGRANAFGREFDSLADIVSFGVAPALLLFNIVLVELQSRTGWGIASLYLVCGALRLSRFNVLAAMNEDKAGKEFTGLPIPAAAGLISSVTLWMLTYYYEESIRALEHGTGKYFLAGLMIFCSLMMFSKFQYPSFKNFNWRTEHSIQKFIFICVVLCATILFYRVMLAVIFLFYLFYGFFRPFISKALRKEIEEDDDDL
ncbi:MAG: CDP-diacylglycerol--serine O-phosphatidyltransferase [Verrucomicrobiota bacterium]